MSVSLSSFQPESFRVHSSVNAIALSVPIGQRLVSKKFNQTSNQAGMERAVCVPAEAITAPELEESGFRALVESALHSAAVAALAKWVKQGNESVFDVPAELFTRPALIEEFMGAEQWMDKSQLDLAFTGSATWARISGRPEMKSNAVYRKKAEYIKEHILKLAGKRVSIKPEVCDTLISLIDEKDLSTEFGVFAVKRLSQIRDRTETEKEMDISGL